MPAYRVEVQRSAEGDLDRLSRELFDRIAQRLAALGEDPRPQGSEKLGGVDAYRVRAGDYRIIYQIDDKAGVVRVLRIRHRREVYRRLR